MVGAWTLGDISPGLGKVMERAKREPEGRFNSLAHLIDVPALERVFHRRVEMRRWARMGSRRSSTNRTWRPSSRTCTHG